MAWDQLNAVYAREGIVPVLGAGVSARSGLPEWTELLRRIGARCAPPDGEALVATLCREGFSLPAIAAMLRAVCRSDEGFTEVVRSELYRSLPDQIRLADDATAAAMVNCVRTQNLTLSAVAALCAIATGSEPPFISNPRIHAIVTFNVDAVLREYVEARYDGALVRSVERASKEPMNGRIDLYYMHGFLRYDRKARTAGKEGADKLVLAEQEYFDFFNNPTALFNYTFLYHLRTHACLFIGASMKDDNIRRLLHYSMKERVQAFKEEGKTDDVARAGSIRHFAVLKHYETAAIDTAVERSLEAIGTRTLWIADFGDIPDRLGEMYAAGGQQWSAVYES